MSVQAMSWAFAQQIPPSQKIVLLSIANCADKNGDNAYPGQDHLAADASMSVRSVQRHLDWLEERGLLTRVRRSRKNGTRTSDRYILDLSGKATNCQVVGKETRRQPGYDLHDTVVVAINRKRNRQLESDEEKEGKEGKESVVRGDGWL